MDDREFTLAGLAFKKDMAIAELTSRTARWRLVPAASLTLSGLGIYGFWTAALGLPGFLAVQSVAAGAIVVAHVAVRNYEVIGERLLVRFLRDIDRLKRGGRP